jgi:general secretion pathway protein M
MRTYWANLNERERWIGGLGVACLLIYLFYLLIYSPLNTAVTNGRQQLIEKKETLAWMKDVQHQISNNKKANSINRNKLLTIIAAQLGNKPLQTFPYQLQQTSQGEIQLSFDEVPYSLFLKWLWALNQEYIIVINQLSAERTKTSGLVKLNIVISTP